MAHLILRFSESDPKTLEEEKVLTQVCLTHFFPTLFPTFHNSLLHLSDEYVELRTLRCALQVPWMQNNAGKAFEFMLEKCEKDRAEKGLQSIQQIREVDPDSRITKSLERPDLRNRAWTGQEGEKGHP
eukprot:1341548-Amorphochlora_amoeboformis.AAC.1